MLSTKNLEQSSIKAPFDGVIIEGDENKLLGSPLNKGDLVFKIAKLENLYLTINLDEKYIDEVKRNALGEFILLTRPDEKIKLVISQIVPIAKVDSKQQNIFVLKAKILEKSKTWWRPGMNGVVKINVGKRKIIWLLTHKIVEFFRLYFWI